MSGQGDELYVRPDYSWNQLPFQANGAAIAIYIAALTTLISGGKFHSSIAYIIPVIGYLLGLCFSYVTHMLHVTLQMDHDQRKRLNAGRQLIIQNKENSGLPDTQRQQLDFAWQTLAKEYANLLAPEKTRKYVTRAANFYAASLLLFLGSTILVTVQFGLFLLSP